MLTRIIPKSGEALPAIGLGTWSTFDVARGQIAPLAEVLSRFFDGGGRVIDSSPMYGRAEAVIGELSSVVARPPGVFLATKVWCEGRQRGIEQMNASMRLMRASSVDLMQIHNLVDWRVHLETLREWKAAGRVRYIGITHYQVGAFGEMERILRTEDVDFVQLPYSVGMRAAEERLLPAALETKTAVLVMRPFEEGDRLRALAKRPLPDWAGEIGCASWAEVLLKFVLAHPAVTCPIPATSSAAHVVENMRALSGALPDAALRSRIVAAL